jgi:hypothetical protein
MRSTKEALADVTSYGTPPPIASRAHRGGKSGAKEVLAVDIGYDNSPTAPSSRRCESSDTVCDSQSPTVRHRRDEPPISQESPVVDTAASGYSKRPHSESPKVYIYTSVLR